MSTRDGSRLSPAPPPHPPRAIWSSCELFLLLSCPGESLPGITAQQPTATAQTSAKNQVVGRHIGRTSITPSSVTGIALSDASILTGMAQCWGMWMMVACYDADKGLAGAQSRTVWDALGQPGMRH
ncbi:unnamed protein product [Boreogadus saida]